MAATDDIAAKHERRNRRVKARADDDARVKTAVLRAMMTTPDGRRYIWNELAECHIFEQVIIPGQPELSAMREGRRLKGLVLLLEVTRSFPNEYIQMTRENAAVKLEEEKDDERSPDSDD